MVISQGLMGRHGRILQKGNLIFISYFYCLGWWFVPPPFLYFIIYGRKINAKIQAYLDTPPSERDVVAGATLLLSLNSNKILFQNVVRKPEKFADKVEYELRKHLKIRLDGKPYLMSHG